MKKAELILKVALATGRPSAQVKAILDEITDQINLALADGDRLILRGFGTFETRVRAARTARNPKTDETVVVPAATVVRFRPSKALKELVAGDE